MGKYGQSKLELLMEDWRSILTFPDYEICSDGRVRNKHTGDLVKIYWINGSGVVFLLYKKKLYSRGVKKLLKKIHGIKERTRTPQISKCNHCGAVMPVKDIQMHLITCDTRDPNIEYFEY